MVVLWMFLKANIFESSGTNEEKFEHGVMMLRVELMSFYKSYHKDHPMEDLTRLSNLSMKMLGTPSQPKLKTKGMETWGILLFCVAMLHKHSGKMQTD